MTGSVSRGSNTVLNHKEQMRATETKTLKVSKKCLWFKNYQQRKVFITNRGSNEKLSLKLVVLKFQKRSFQIICLKT